MERLQDSDGNIKQTALDCIQTLCNQGIIFFNFTALNVHQPSDDIRETFISSNGIQKIIDKLHDLDKYVRWTALDCIKKLCIQGIIFYYSTLSDFYHNSDDIQTAFISSKGIQKVIEKLQHSDKDIWQTALDCIKILYAQGKIFSYILALNFTIL